MTDYLELLLEAEEDEEETTVEWETPVILGLEREPGGPVEKAELAGRQTAAEERSGGWTALKVATGEVGGGWTALKMDTGEAGDEWTELKMTAEERQYRVQDVPEMLAKETGTADRISSWERAIARNRTEEAAGGVLAGVGSGTQLYQQVKRLRRAAETVRGESRGTERTVVVRQEGAPGLTVEGMDRAVQRDARRYDGGFGLY